MIYFTGLSLAVFLNNEHLYCNTAFVQRHASQKFYTPCINKTSETTGSTAVQPEFCVKNGYKLQKISVPNYFTKQKFKVLSSLSFKYFVKLLISAY